MHSPTLIIAEAGVNHNGDLDAAKRLIDVAAEAGADFVKFQTFTADRVVTRTAGKAEYQISSSGAGESQYEMLRRLELTPEAHRILIDHCKFRRIAFLSTAFDIESVDVLVALGLEYLKVPSGEITNLPYLRHVGGQCKKVILSTGMATLDEVGAAIEVLEQAGTSRTSMTVLHCTTEYPTPMMDVNLRAMLTIRDAFGVAVGYSDHTSGIEVATAAVALGATVVEKHFTLDINLPGPDHKASLAPDQLKALVRAIRHIETALGDGIKRPGLSEAKNKPVVRKSLVAAKPILAGEVFTVDNLAAKRPGIGISPMRWDEILGQKATRNYVADEFIEL
jgi:N,N'-diacetyllegionaminate synthase